MDSLVGRPLLSLVVEAPLSSAMTLFGDDDDDDDNDDQRLLLLLRLLTTTQSGDGGEGDTLSFLLLLLLFLLLLLLLLDPATSCFEWRRGVLRLTVDVQRWKCRRRRDEGMLSLQLEIYSKTSPIRTLVPPRPTTSKKASKQDVP
jgi:hypothetical protein